MPAGKALKAAPAAAPASGGDRISALPDELLHRVLSLLPAQQVVQTCVLARRWLHLWKSAPGLCVVGSDGKAPAPFEEVREFVDSLLLLRGSSPLQTFELRIAGAAIDARRLRLWVRYALQCDVQVLRLIILGKTRAMLRPEDPPLASRHLTDLQLRGLKFNYDFLDFSRCPALQQLCIEDCVFIHAQRISSQSVKNLTIVRSIFNRSSRIQIHTPNLASLVLQVSYGRTPVLDRMPLLVSASVAIFRNIDCCSRSINGDCGDESCNGCIQNDTSPVLLPGLSQVKTLELLALAQTFIFRRDLKWCPTFSQLKRLELNEQLCVPDVHGLACLLEHSPVLEKLAVLLFYKGHGRNVTMIGRFNPKELPPTISVHLKSVQVTCGALDERVVGVLKFLSKLNISFSF